MRQFENIPELYYLFLVKITRTYKCENRELAVGELAVIVENLSIAKHCSSEENYKKFCFECNFRNVDGYIKIEFDKKMDFTKK